MGMKPKRKKFKLVVWIQILDNDKALPRIYKNKVDASIFGWEDVRKCILKEI